MNKPPPAPNPEAYVAALDGWRRELVEPLRTAALVAATLEDARGGDAQPRTRRSD
jgi:hypothetical protein